MSIRKLALLVGLTLGIYWSGAAADLVSVKVLTDKILILHFDEGFVNYNGYRQESSATLAERKALDLSWVQKPTSFSIISSEDESYKDGLVPAHVYRKSKPHQISNICNWVNSICDNEVVFEHFIYLEMAEAFQPGKRYNIEFTQSGQTGESHELHYVPFKTRSDAIHVNQIGYLPQSKQKFGYLSHWLGDGGGLNLDDYEGASFYLIDPISGAILFTNTISKRLNLASADNYELIRTPDQGFLSMSDVWQCDFSAFSEPGEYVLAVEGMGVSFPFEIRNSIYQEPFYHVARQLYHQRSGIALTDEFTQWIRPRNLHPDDGRIKFLYTSSVWPDWEGSRRENGVKDEVLAKVDSTFEIAPWGWYMDAGDWDGYYNHTKVPRYLMTAYELAPDNFSDSQLNIPESGNGLPDILDEAQWLLDYLNRTRGPTGGIAGARVHPDFEDKENDFIPSWEDNRTWLVSGEDPVTTYTFAGMSAHFAICLGIAGSQDSTLWAQRAQDTYEWAKANEEITNGSLVHGRLYAAANMYKLTGDKEYEVQFMADIDLPDTRNESYYNRDFAEWAYLSIDHANRDQEFWQQLMQNRMQSTIEDYVETALDRSFRVGWTPQFQTFLGQGSTPQIFPSLVMYHLTGDQQFLDIAITSVDYYMGGNPLDMNWIVGLGDHSPQSILHLDTWYHPDRRQQYIPGTIPYGPVAPGLSWTPNNGPWSSDFAWDRVYPEKEQWPLHEGYFDNKLAVPTNEYTIHQTTAPAAAILGLLAGASQGMINLNQPPNVSVSHSDLILGEMVSVTAVGSDEDGYVTSMTIYVNNHQVAVEQSGNISAAFLVTDDNADIEVVAIDNKGARSKSQFVAVNSQVIETVQDAYTLYVGDTIQINAEVFPENVTIPGLYWQVIKPSIAEVHEGEVIARSAGQTTVEMRTVDGQTFSAIQINVLNEPLGIDNILSYPFPNPVSEGMLYFHQELKVDSCQILTLEGKALIEATRSGRYLDQLNISKIPAGLYLLKIKSASDSRTFKIYIQP